MGMRASDQDRVDVANLLREAAAEGRLAMDELSERIGEAMASKTYSDLHRCLRELPSYESYRPWQKVLASDVHAATPRHERRSFARGVLVPLAVGVLGLIILSGLTGAVGTFVMLPGLIVLPIRVMLDILFIVLIFRLLRFFIHLRR